MEALALIFAIAVFIALLLPEQKPPKPSAGDTLLKGLQEAAGEIFAKDILKSKEPPKPKDNPWGSAGAVMIYFVLLGLLLACL